MRLAAAPAILIAFQLHHSQPLISTDACARPATPRKAPRRKPPVPKPRHPQQLTAMEDGEQNAHCVRALPSRKRQAAPAAPRRAGAGGGAGAGGLAASAAAAQLG